LTLWDRVQAVFLSLADLPPEERAQQLDAVCAGDSELRSEVDSLLKSDSNSAQSISEAIGSESAMMLGDVPAGNSSHRAVHITLQAISASMG
jgi:hypothetical protein